MHLLKSLVSIFNATFFWWWIITDIKIWVIGHIDWNWNICYICCINIIINSIIVFVSKVIIFCFYILVFLCSFAFYSEDKITLLHKKIFEQNKVKTTKPPNTHKTKKKNTKKQTKTTQQQNSTHKIYQFQLTYNQNIRTNIIICSNILSLFT